MIESTPHHTHTRTHTHTHSQHHHCDTHGHAYTCTHHVLSSNKLLSQMHSQLFTTYRHRRKDVQLHSLTPHTHIHTPVLSLSPSFSLSLSPPRTRQYTCMAACDRFLAVGANTGGVYFFERRTLRYMQVSVLPSHDTRFSNPTHALTHSPIRW